MSLNILLNMSNPKLLKNDFKEYIYINIYISHICIYISINLESFFPKTFCLALLKE